MNTFKYTLVASVAILSYSCIAQQATTLDSLKVLGKTEIKDYLDVDKDVHLKDSLRIDKNLDVKGATKIKGEIVVKGDSKLKGKTTITGKTVMKDNAVVHGDLKVKSLEDPALNDNRLMLIQPNGKLNVVSGLRSTSSFILETDGDVAVGGNSIVKKDLTVYGLEEPQANYDKFVFVDGQGKFKVTPNIKCTPNHALDLNGNLKLNGTSEFQDDVKIQYMADPNNTSGEIKPLYVGADGILRIGSIKLPPPIQNCGSSGDPIIPFMSEIGSDDVFLCGYNMGIGTSDPQFPLDVVGDAHISGSLKMGDNSLYVGADGSNNHYIYTTGSGGVSHPLRINGLENNNTSGVQNTYINPNGGRVGIGAETNPTGRLQVYNTDVSTAALCLDQIVTGDYSSALRINVNNDKTASIQVHDGTETVFKVMGNGFVWAKEIIVQSDPFPDYVFNSEYELMSINNLEQYIKVHGRLPNMPSAATVDKEGISLGSVQVKLVEKVEELTLYTIEQQKSIDRLMVVIESLSDQNNKMEAELQKIIKTQ